MNSLTALAVAGLLAVSQADNDHKEKLLPVTPQALAGRWELRSGDNVVTVEFLPKSVFVEAWQRGLRGQKRLAHEGDYEIDAKARSVRIHAIGVGRLVNGGELRLSFRLGFLWLPKGAVITLDKRMPGEDP
jgi:hypothetical protein